MMLSIPIFLSTFRREVVLTAGLVLWCAPTATTHRDATFEYDVGNLSESLFMATSPTNFDVYLYSPDHLTVLDQKLQERRASACKLNSSNLWFGGGQFHCQNSHPGDTVSINCQSLAETETTVQLDVGTSPLLSSREHAHDPPPWSTNVSKDTRVSCMQRVLQFENMEIDLPAGSRYLYGYKADDGSLFAVILKSKEVEGNAYHDQFVTELHMYGLQERKWTFQGSRVLKCVKTEDNWLVDFEQATSAIAIRQHSSEQFPGTSVNVLYVAFLMQTNVLEAEGSYIRHDSSLCRFVLDDFKDWSDQLNEWRAHEMVFPHTTVLSLRTAILDYKPILVAHERQLISLINISWKTSQNSNLDRELEYHFNDTNRTQVRQIETSFNWIYALTDKQVLKLSTDRCGQFRYCHDCVGHKQNRNVFCGWCALEKRCSTQASCQSAFNDEKNETAPQLWLNAWSKEPPNCPNFSPRSPGFTIAVDDERTSADSAERLNLSTQVRGKRHAPDHVARHSASGPFEVMFRADGLPVTGTYLKRLSCEFRFPNRGNFSSENTRVLIKTKTESNLRTRSFHCDMPIEHLKYKTFANRPGHQLEGQFQVSLVHNMDTREDSKHELATSNIRLIDCSTVDSCTYCSGRDVCMWANGKCTSRIKKETGGTIADDCPKMPSENDQPDDGFHIVKIDRKDHSEHPPFEVVLYTYNLTPDADVSQLAVSAGPYFCENLTKIENQTLTCSFLVITNVETTFITVANRTSNATVRCRFCQPFKSGLIAAEPPSFPYHEVLLLLALTVGPVTLLILLISVIHVRDELRKEKVAKNLLGMVQYTAVDQAPTSDIPQRA